MNKIYGDTKIRRPEELLNLYGMDYRSIQGYAGLTDLNKAIYKRFIVNIYNATGAQNRARLVPKAINFVEQHEFLVKQNPKDDFFLVAGGKTEAINKYGERILIDEWHDPDCVGLEVLGIERETYLRFDYEQNGKKMWQHVVKNGAEWY